MLLAVTTIATFLCYHIKAEACTTQQRAALRRLYLFLGYSLHAGYGAVSSAEAREASFGGMLSSPVDYRPSPFIVAKLQSFPLL